MTDDLFPGFASHWIDGEAGRVFARSGGSGPPLVLLHGFPETHASFHRIAPALARTHTVVCPDLRGYGWSSAPKGDPVHETYSKRAMGRDVIRVMEKLGHVRFALAGHDRGARVAYRLALDEPGRVERLALLDIVPTFANWQRIREGQADAPHWDYLARPFPQPETEIGRDPLAYFDGLLAKWSKDGTLDVFDPRALAAYRQSCNEPSRIHAFCEDYRAGATVDCARTRRTSPPAGPSPARCWSSWRNSTSPAAPARCRGAARGLAPELRASGHRRGGGFRPFRRRGGA